MAEIPISFGGGGGSGSADVTASRNQVLEGYTAITIDSNDEPTEGAIPSKETATYYTSTSDRTIASGQYLSGNQIIKAVTSVGLNESNIKKNVQIKIGDSANDTRVKSLTGTYTTPSDGQSAATAATIRTGYSGFVNGGGIIDGSMANYTGNTTITPSKTDQTLSTSGKYCTSNITVNGDANLVAANIKKDVVIFGVTGSAPEFKYINGTESGLSGTAYNFEKVSGSVVSQGNIELTNKGFVPQGGFIMPNKGRYTTDHHYIPTIWWWYVAKGWWTVFSVTSGSFDQYVVNKQALVLNNSNLIRVPVNLSATYKCYFWGY